MTLIAALTTVVMTVAAAPVGKEKALENAKAFARQHMSAAKADLLVATDNPAQHLAPGKAGKAGEAPFHLYRVATGQGYVVAGGDDLMPEVLGYSDTDALPADGQLPQNMQAWLQQYAYAVKTAAQRKAKRYTSSAAWQPVAPLLTTLWDQDAPYNNLCPMDNGQRSVTGCVATAMAQVIAYHRYPNKTTATIPAYTTYTKGIKVGAIAPTTIDWANMLDEYNGSETSQQKKAVATLMKLCGASVQMDYTNQESGAYSESVADALKTYFDFDAATTTNYREDYYAAQWDSLVYAELAANRPVAYSGVSAGGGHEFVIDGYDGQGFFHVNWGWGGSSNGYFLLSILDSDDNSGIGASSTADGYSMMQDCVTGAQPNTGVEPEKHLMMSIYNISSEQDSYTRKSNRTFTLSLDAEFYNSSGETATFDVAAVISKAGSDEPLYTVPFIEDVELEEWYGWQNYHYELSGLDGSAMPLTANTDYYLTLACRANNDTEWHLMDNHRYYTLLLKEQGNTLHVMPLQSELTATMEVEPGKINNEELPILVHLKNIGNQDFHDQLALFIKGPEDSDYQAIGGRYIDVLAGGEADFSQVFLPEVSGTYSVRLCYNLFYPEESMVAESTFEVAQAPIHNIGFSGKMPAITNINGKYGVDDNKVSITFTIDATNDDNDFDDMVALVAYEYEENDEGSFSWVRTTDMETQQAFVNAGSTGEVTLTLRGLTEGYYYFVGGYRNNGIFIWEWNSYYLFYVSGYDDTPTAIDATPADRPQTKPNDGAVYTLDGRRIDAQTLKPGLYIKDGKKVAVK